MTRNCGKTEAMKRVIVDQMDKMKPGEKLHVLHEGDVAMTITRNDPDKISPRKTAIHGPNEVPPKTPT